RKLTFISALALNTLRSAARAQVIVAEPIAVSHRAARNPPCNAPDGLEKRSSACISQTVVPGVALSMQTIPSSSSELAGTWTLGSATRASVDGLERTAEE